MSQKAVHEYDVFISYANQDKAFVENELLPKLKTRGLKPFIDFIDFKPGKPELDEIKRGIESSRKTLLLVSPHYLKDNLSDLEKQITRYIGVTAKETMCIPVIIAPCKLPDDLSYLVCIYLTSKNEQERGVEWTKLLKSLTEDIPSKPLLKKEKTPKRKKLALPKMEKELRMNKAHWITAGFSMPAEKFNFTAVYFENQLDIFRRLRTEVKLLADGVNKDKTKPRQAAFLKKAYETLDKLQSRTSQVSSILDTDKDHQFLLVVQKATTSLIENTIKARQSLMKSSVSGTVHPKEFDLTAAQLPTEFYAIVISIEEVERHLKRIYQLAEQSVQVE